MQYLAIIGDIVASRQLPRRQEVQGRLATLLRRVSQDNPALASPYTITLGDEFQAVYRQADTLFVDIVTILQEVHPVQVRFAVGVGELATGLNRKQALGMDGPAFHRARAAIEELKKSGYFLRLQGAPADESGADPWRLINHSLNLVSHRVDAWSRNRLRILQGLLAGKSVGALEKALRISNVAVYKNINAGALDEVRGLCEDITAFLNRELKK